MLRPPNKNYPMLTRGAIYKCDSSHKVFYCLIWSESLGPGLICECGHGFVKNSNDSVQFIVDTLRPGSQVRIRPNEFFEHFKNTHSPNLRKVWLR
jgi:hypothetical protein